MRDVDLYRLVARQRLLAGCERLLALPWQFNARAGVLHLDGEPLLLPRHWQREDNGYGWAGGVLRAAWESLGITPLRMIGYLSGSASVGLWAWRMSARYGYGAAENEGDPEPVLFCGESEAGAPFTEFELPWEEGTPAPDLDETLLQCVEQVLRAALASRLQGIALDDPDLCAVSAELANAAMAAFSAFPGRDGLRDALLVLSAEHAEDGEEPSLLLARIARLPVDSPLHADVRRLAQLDVQAAHQWPPEAQALRPWIPLLPRELRETGDADRVRDWLRGQGLSRKALARLAFLPVAVSLAFVEVCAQQACTRNAHTVAWFGRLLAALYQRRARCIGLPALLDAARAAALCGALHDRHEEALRSGWRTAGFDDGDVLIAESPPDAFTAILGTALVGLLRCRGRGNRQPLLTGQPLHGEVFNGMGEVAAAFVTTLMHALLGDDGIAREDIHEQLPDVRDWLCFSHAPRDPHSRVLRVQDVSPRWATLRAGEQRWHADFHARRGALDVELQRRIDRGEAIDPRRFPGYVPPPPAPALAWSALCEAFSLGDIDVLPLTSSVALVLEGRRMQHCVGNYAPVCLRQGHRIFSLRYAPDDSAIATAEFAPGHAGWRLLQLRGPRNEQLLRNGEVAEPYADVISEVLARLDAAEPAARGSRRRAA